MDITNIHNVCGFLLNYQLVSFSSGRLLDWQEMLGQLEPLSKTTAPFKGQVLNDGRIKVNSRAQTYGSFFHESAACCISHLNDAALF
jgi:hypothetical protein